MHDFAKRHRRFLEGVSVRKLDGFLVTHPPNLQYLFNFKGSTGLALCLEGESRLLVDSRYFEQAQRESVNCEPVLSSAPLTESLRQMLYSSSSSSRQRLGVEARHISYDTILSIRSWRLPLRLKGTQNLIEQIRAVKEETEISVLQQAFQLARSAYDRLLETIEPGQSEIEVAALLEYELRKGGGEGLAFETIVASADRSSLPHAAPSGRIIRKGELVLIDFGVRYGGYCSDMTRVCFLPPVSRPGIFDIVQEAQDAALVRVKPGVLSTDIDSAAREVIARHGYGENFGHSTGHGLGLEIHELPGISPRRPVTIECGMVFTIEPGIYLPGQYGIRLEEALVVTPTGHRLLSR